MNNTYPIKAVRAGRIMIALGFVLQSHIRVSMNVGITAPQLRQFIQALATRVDAATAQRAQAALEKILSNQGGTP